MTDGERFGLVSVVLAEPKRGLTGGAVTDVQVEWDGGVAEWVDPCALLPECDDDRR